nr:copia protein [Tanacetum cinerariifolium]
MWRPLFHRFAKADSLKVMPPPLSGDYTSLSDHSDLDESQMSYGTKSLTFSDSKSVSNDFVSCDDSDKSSEVNTNDFASSDSSVISSEPKPNDSNSCASTSSISTSKNEAEIKTNVGTPIQEPIIAGHFRKHASSVSKLCFVCGSDTHIINDCDFYEKQIANKNVGIRVGPVHYRNKVNHPNQFVPQAVLLRTGKVNIPPARLQPVPTGKPKVFTPVPTGRPNRPFPVPTDRGYSPSSIPDDHVADFHYIEDARDIWNAVKDRFGGNAESKKMRKSTLKQEFSEFRISETEGLHKRMQVMLENLLSWVSLLSYWGKNNNPSIMISSSSFQAVAILNRLLDIHIIVCDPMDVKSAFLYETIEEKVYVCQLPGFEDPAYPDKELCKTFKKLMKDKFQMSSMRELTFFLRLQVKKKEDRIFICQDKYVAEILRKFGFTNVKSASTPIETEKPLLKDPDGEDVDVHLYSNYAGASLDRKFTTGGCQFLGCRLISWQRKKKTIIATSSIEAEYVAVVLLEAQQLSNDSPLLGVNTPRCDEDSIELKELMVVFVPICVLRKMELELLLSVASDGFNQVVDFLNAHTIKYALMVNPTIYVSSIKQFWATTTVETVNGDVQLQVLINDKKAVVTEAIIRRDLCLDDADGVECLPNAKIFEEFARIGYEKPPPKLTFYKEFFSAQWKFLIHTIV